MDDSPIRQAIAGGETATVEFKINVPRPAELAERLCGMANTRSGGVLLIGVADADNAIVGITNPSAALDGVLRAARLLTPALSFADDPTTVLLDDRAILVIAVPPNAGVLYQAGGVFWLRRDTHTTPMRLDEVSQHLHTAGTLQWETALCPHATLDELDMQALDAYLALRDARSQQHLRHTARDEVLLGLRCAGRDPQTGVLRPTNAGILMFGRDPQFRLPQSEVVCVQYTDTLGVGRYHDRKILHGTLPAVIDQAAQFLQQAIRVGGEIVGFTRVDLPEYPLEALREAVVNAVVHRDYALAGEAVRVFCYADRIEVRSPGMLPFGVTVEDMVQLRVQSRPRHPVIAQFMRDMPGYMERIGMGIRLMVHEMQQMGLPPPEFVEQHEFAVLFRNGRAVQDASSPFTPRQLRGLELVRASGSISSREYMAATGVSESTALRELRAMVARGVIVARGKTRGVRYYLP